MAEKTLVGMVILMTDQPTGPAPLPSVRRSSPPLEGDVLFRTPSLTGLDPVWINPPKELPSQVFGSLFLLKEA